MTKVHFDFSVRPTVVQSDREQFHIRELDIKGLRRLARGKIFMTIDSPRDFIVIVSEVLDYLVQLKGVTDQIDSGNYDTFTVSGDYFSNNLRFTYDEKSKKLQVYERNGGTFAIVLSYRDFRTGLVAFYNQAMSDLLLLYPELESNDAFQRLSGRF